LNPGRGKSRAGGRARRTEGEAIFAQTAKKVGLFKKAQHELMKYKVIYSTDNPCSPPLPFSAVPPSTPAPHGHSLTTTLRGQRVTLDSEHGRLPGVEAFRLDEPWRAPGATGHRFCRRLSRCSFFWRFCISTYK
jgi:hypothetical protein